VTALDVFFLLQNIMTLSQDVNDGGRVDGMLALHMLIDIASQNIAPAITVIVIRPFLWE
jgi:ABC-type glycerol-3-phosphate transport system permease component